VVFSYPGPVILMNIDNLDINMPITSNPSLNDSALIRSSDYIASPLDDGLHLISDLCLDETPLHVAVLKKFCSQQVNLLKSLSSDEQANILGVVGATPVNRVKSILLNNKVHHPGLILSKSGLALAVKDCYNEICAGRYDDRLIFALIDGIIDRTEEDARTKGEGIKDAVEQLLHLASRFVKGQACGEEDCNGCYAGDSATYLLVQKDFALGIMDLDQFAKEQKLEIKLSDRASYSLLKLCSIFGEYYDSIRYLAKKPEPFYFVQLEEMWCNWRAKDSDCRCWDYGEIAFHHKGCELNEW
jgi:hypothetical protein